MTPYRRPAGLPDDPDDPDYLVDLGLDPGDRDDPVYPVQPAVRLHRFVTVYLPGDDPRPEEERP